MIFGTREARAALGKFTSDKCAACKKSNEYVFYRVTKYIVVLFMNLIPIGNSYECECIKCDDNLPIDKKAGRKLAKQKFGVENSNQNFVIFFKLFVVALIIAAAIVLPLIFVKPPISPQVLKDLIDEDGQYTILNKDADMVGILTIIDGMKQLEFYDDISKYKSETGKVFTQHKKYEEVFTVDGSHLVPIADDFGGLVDENLIKVQRYYYDIANSTYGYYVGVEDLSAIVYTDVKAVYPITVYNSPEDIANYKLIVFNEDGREIYARFELIADGTEVLSDIRVIEKADGLDISETLYIAIANSTDITFFGAVNSDSSANEFVEFIMNNSLQIGYMETYTYYSGTNVITGIETTVFDNAGNASVSSVNYTLIKKDGYYILQEITPSA